MVSVDEVREVAQTLPRAYEVLVRGRIKFRVGRIVWLSFSRDGSTMGFAFPREWRPALVESEPEKFMLPGQTDLKYNWAVARLAALQREEMRALVLDAWSIVVPTSVVEQYLRLGGPPRLADPDLRHHQSLPPGACRGHASSRS